LDCPLCSQLGENETSFSKYGWPDGDYAMTPAAGQLEPVEPLDSSNENHHLKRCTLCGTFYRYDSWYEYYVNGSEDNESLLRLAPPEALPFISESEYALSMQAARSYLSSSEERIRRYAGACLLSHAAAAQDMAAVKEICLHADLDAAKGAVVYLFHLAEQYDSLLKLRSVAGLDAALAASAAELMGNHPQETPHHALGKLIADLSRSLFPST